MDYNGILRLIFKLLFTFCEHVSAVILDLFISSLIYLLKSKTTQDIRKKEHVFLMMIDLFLIQVRSVDFVRTVNFVRTNYLLSQI